MLETHSMIETVLINNNARSLYPFFLFSMFSRQHIFIIFSPILPDELGYI
jgi:hypothetical protein